MGFETEFEIVESPDEGARFCIAHSDEHGTVGLLILKSDSELTKHRWPGAAKLLQVSGQSALTIENDDNEIQAQHELAPGNNYDLPSGTWHIVTNTGDDESVVLFKIAGNAQEMLEQIRATYTAIDLETAQ
jgi:quercetin dioxygenase-like cupin family protein